MYIYINISRILAPLKWEPTSSYNFIEFYCTIKLLRVYQYKTNTCLLLVLEKQYNNNLKIILFHV